MQIAKYLKEISGFVCKELIIPRVIISFACKEPVIPNEIIGFGLRIKNGINLSRIPLLYQEAVNHSISQNQSKWGGVFIRENDCLKLTPAGFAFADSIAIDLMID